MASPSGDSRRRSRQHVDVEGVATRATRRASRRGRGVAAHHSPAAIDQGGGEAGLDRRQRHPTAVEAQHAVVVEVGDVGRRDRARRSRALDAGVQVDLVGAARGSSPRARR